MDWGLTCNIIVWLGIHFSTYDGAVQSKESLVPCDLEPSMEKGLTYYRRRTPWGKWLDMPCPPKTVFIAHWCRCDYPEMEEMLTESNKNNLTSSATITEHLTTQPKSKTSPTTSTSTTPIKTENTRPTTSTIPIKTEKTPIIQTTTIAPSKTSISMKSTTTNSEILSTFTPTKSEESSGSHERFSTVKLVVTESTVKPVLTESMTLLRATSQISDSTLPTISINSSELSTNGHEHNQDNHTLESQIQVTKKSPEAVRERNITNTTSVSILNSTSSSNSEESSNEHTNQTTSYGHGSTSVTNSTINTTTRINTTTTNATTTEPTTNATTTEPTTNATTTESSPIATACKYQKIEDDRISYMGYINAEIGWIRFQCPHHKEFSLTRCGCFYPREIKTTATTTTARTTIGIPEGCPYVKEGRKAFREFIDVLKTWVFSECGESYDFSQLKCGCVLEGTSPDGDDDNSIRTTGSPISTVAVVLTSTEEVPPGCPYIAVGKSSFREYIASMQTWVYSDCAPEHVFKQSACRCEPENIVINGCPFIAVDKSSFKEYIDVLGEWVTSDCPSDFLYSAKLCKCVLKDCKHEAVGLTSFRTFIEEIKDWVTSQCPKNHIYSPNLCKCVNEGGGETAIQITDHVVQPVVTTSFPVSTESLSMVTTADCKAVGKLGGYRRYIHEVDGWVDYDCPIHTEFNIQTCSCQRAGCKYIPDQTGYKEFVDLLGTWIFYDCPIGTSFRTDSCKCEKERPKPRVTTPNPTQPDHHDGKHPGDSEKSTSGCLKVQKNNGYMEFLATLGDWVYYDCPVEHAFSEDDCACVYTGINSSKDGKRTGCAFSSTGDGTYRQFVDEISQWVSYDCPVGQHFHNEFCKCVQQDASSKDLKTTLTPKQITNSSCSMKTSDMGQDYFLLYVEGHGEILYQCDFGFVFNQTQCSCVKEAPNPTTPKTTNITPDFSVRTRISKIRKWRPRFPKKEENKEN
ncbi:uncharacterized protein LOC125679981 isoform X2 [Ostrea edulis]|uniref:uncharacterized protein LOC125679981 isoform X2 n=1 Tax=Ostrea edulis TaxID=37623 RepID=UPI0024AEC66F|nr:uncharacterized protein LOC125679981 isoform X2 [Ostrea edulis]